MCAPKNSTPESIKHWLDRAKDYNQEPRNKGVDFLYRWRLFNRYWDLNFNLKVFNILFSTWVEETPKYHAVNIWGMGKLLPGRKRFEIF